MTIHLIVIRFYYLENILFLTKVVDWLTGSAAHKAWVHKNEGQAVL